MCKLGSSGCFETQAKWLLWLLSWWHSPLYNLLSAGITKWCLLCFACSLNHQLLIHIAKFWIVNLSYDTDWYSCFTICPSLQGSKLIMYIDPESTKSHQSYKRDQHISLMIFTFYNHSQSWFYWWTNILKHFFIR